MHEIRKILPYFVANSRTFCYYCGGVSIFTRISYYQMVGGRLQLQWIAIMILLWSLTLVPIIFIDYYNHHRRYYDDQLEMYRHITITILIRTLALVLASEEIFIKSLIWILYIIHCFFYTSYIIYYLFLALYTYNISIYNQVI